MWRRPLLLACLCKACHALRNSALVFIKPHAATDACEAFVRDRLVNVGINVVSCGTKTGEEIDRLKLIDKHYGSLARLAMDVEPASMVLDASSKSPFLETFGEDWDSALPQMKRNDVALKALNVDGSQLEKMWRSGVQLKLAPGMYISRLQMPAGADKRMYTVNGFYPAMRQAYVMPDAQVRWMVCEFDESDLPWRTFRQEVIGATDPAKAAPGSLRADLLAQWEQLGLASSPTQALNGVHASAGPLEGLKERCVWAGASLTTDLFGAELLSSGVDLGTLDSWLNENPVVTLGKQTGKVLDLTEEKGTDEVLSLVLGNQRRVPATMEVLAQPPAGFVWGNSY